MSYLLRCSSGVQFRGGGCHICAREFFFVFFCAKFFFLFFLYFFILLWGGSAGVKFFLKFFFSREIFIFFLFFSARACPGGCHTAGCHTGGWTPVTGGGWGVHFGGYRGSLILGGFHGFDDFHVFDEF